MESERANAAFEWESIDDYPHVTGIAALDKALAYDAPEGLLKQHFARQEVNLGRSAVISDLEAIISSTPAGSPAHDGCRDWLDRYQRGASVDEL